MSELAFADARALVGQVTAMEVATEAEDLDVSFRTDPQWVQLPPARKSAALTRLHALSLYDGLKRPTKKDAEAAAAKLKVKLRTFYAMLRDWRDQQRSVFALVPYRQADGGRNSKLADDALEKLTLIIDEILRHDPGAAPGEVIRTVSTKWGRSLKKPSDVTIRNYLDRALASHDPEPGTLKLRTGSGEAGATVTAERFGEVIVIDHTAPARILVDGEAVTSPVITIAIDLWSGAPIGAAVSLDGPSPEAVLDALADAMERLDTGMPEGELIEPRILIATTPEQEWSEALLILEDQGCEILEQRDHRLRFGTYAKRLLGPQLASIPLQASKAGRQVEGGSIDVEQDALLTLREMQFLVDDAISKMMKRRVPDGAVGGHVRLGLSALVGRLSLTQRWRPLIDLGSEGRLHHVGMEAHDIAQGLDVHGTDAQRKTYLRELAERIADEDLLDVLVQAPDENRGHWEVEVLLLPDSNAYAVWIELAELALDLGDQGIAVIFAVTADEASTRRHESAVRDGPIITVTRSGTPRMGTTREPVPSIDPSLDRD
ncbi:hypothetical protein EJC47_04335 [Sphingomonas sp. TF3]|uniref:hypothetical protein n=1 Tax=Sphingomonas sp. TF3 TaxID=2495580 RepID=UPI000F88F21B|nr:hypothetical protein [Sphingomonas sp. TF3]RUN77632.1 hypothetical protein EJC47_04335 [Sphingomonas sp. TF3]